MGSEILARSDLKLEMDVKEQNIYRAGIEANYDNFWCPILMQLMVDPVVAADGFSYERS